MFIVIKSVFSVILFFAVPVGIGYFLIQAFKKLLGFNSNEKSQWAKVFGVYLPIGALLTYLTVFLFYKIFGAENFANSLWVIALILSTVGFASVAVLVFKEIKETTLSKLQASSAVLFFTLISQFIWRWKSGLNTSLDWDTFFHQTVINNITNGKFSLMVSNLTDSSRVNAYTTIFHTLLAIPFKLLNPDTLSFWWLAGFAQLVFIALTSYELGFLVCTKLETKPSQHATKLGILVSMLATFSFLSYLAYNPYFLIPQILTATVLINATMYLISEESEKSFLLIFAEMLPAFIFGLLCHTVIGAFGVGLIITLALVLKGSEVKRFNLPKIAAVVTLVCAAILLVISRRLNLTSINPQEAGYYVLSPIEVFSHFTTFYGLAWIVLLVVGIVFLLKQNKAVGYGLFILLIISATVFLSPVPYSLKFLSITSFIINTIMGIGFLTLVNPFFKKSNALGYTSFVVFGFCLTFNLLINVIAYKQTPTYMELYSHVSQNEVGAAIFLKNGYANKNALLVSDPATMFIEEALSGVNSPGGAYVSVENRQKIASIYFNRDKINIRDSLLSVSDGNTGKAGVYLLILSHRFFEWVQSSDEQINAFYYNVWRPSDLKIEDYSLIQFLKNNVTAKMVYSNQGLVIFEVNR